MMTFIDKLVDLVLYSDRLLGYLKDKNLFGKNAAELDKLVEYFSRGAGQTTIEFFWDIVGKQAIKSADLTLEICKLEHKVKMLEKENIRLEKENARLQKQFPKDVYRYPEKLDQYIDEQMFEYVEENIYDKVVENEELRMAVIELLKTLRIREERIIRKYFGIGEVREMSLDEIAEEEMVTRERIRQIIMKALRKMRHPSRTKKLKEFIDL